MPTTITGNPTGIVAPMVTPPTPNQVPAISAPIDGEGAGAGSLSSMEQQSMNHIAFLMQQAVWNATFPTTATNLPQMRFKDAAGNGRSVVDHNGYSGLGRVSQRNLAWDFANGALSAGVQVGTPWSAVLGTAAALTVLAPTASYNDRFLQVTPSSTASTGQANITSWPYLIANTAGMSLVLEFEFGLSVAGTASNVTWYTGLAATTDPSTDVSLCCLAKKYNNANYSVYTGNGVINGVTTTSTPPTTGAFPTDRIRIEIQGSASPYAAYQARFFVNETLMTTVAAGNLPGATAMRLIVGCLNEGGAPTGSPLGYVGPIQETWNRFTSGPNL